MTWSWRTGGSFDAMLGRALGVKREESHERLATRAATYDAATLHAAEVERDSKRQQQLAINRRKFVDGPVLTLVFRHMNVQFNPQNLQPLGDAGTVYPTVRVTDDWGVIEGTDGALMKSDWSALVVPAPASTSGSKIAGDGWTLELKPGWKIVPDTRSGDYTLAPPS